MGIDNLDELISTNVFLISTDRFNQFGGISSYILFIVLEMALCVRTMNVSGALRALRASPTITIKSLSK